MSDRYARVRRAFLRQKLDGRRAALWEAWSMHKLSHLVGALLYVLALSSAFLVLWSEPPFWPQPWWGSDAMAWGTLAWFPVAAWMGDRFAAAHTPAALRVRPTARALRILLAGTPIVGLYLLAAWRDLTRSAPRLVFGPARRGSRPFAVDAVPRDSATRHLSTGRGVWQCFHAWAALGILPALVWTVRASAGPRALPSRTPLVVCLALHVLAATALTHHAWPHWPWRTGRARALLTGACSLLPVVGGVVGMALLFTVGRSGADGTLVHALFGERAGAARGGRWQVLDTRVRRFWERERWWRQAGRPVTLDQRQASGRSLAALVSLCRVQVLLAFLDGVWLGGWGAARGLSWTAFVLAITGAAMLAALVGLATWVVVGVAILARVRRLIDAYERRPWPRYFALAPAAVGWGLVFGQAFAGPHASMPLPLMVYVNVFIGVAAGTLPLLIQVLAPSTVRDARDALWTVVWWALTAVLAGVLPVTRAGGTFQEFVAHALWVTLAIHVVTAATLGRWLTRPLGMRDLLAPGWPLVTRAGLLALRLSAALPFGGLAAPVWILTRDRVERAIARHLERRCRRLA